MNEPHIDHHAGHGVSSAGAIVSSLIAAMAARNMEKARPLLAEDAVLDNVPLHLPAKLTVGADAIVNRVQMLLDACVKVEWEILSQAEQGGLVFNERIDRFWFRPGLFPRSDLLEWPVCARWTVQAGRISLWRDYYEPHLYEAQLGVDISEFSRRIGYEYSRRIDNI